MFLGRITFALLLLAVLAAGLGIGNARPSGATAQATLFVGATPSDCDHCDGRGFNMTAETVCFEIFREIIRQHRQFRFDEVLVLAHQDVIDLLLDEEAAGLAEIEEQIGKSIRLQPESLYTKDQFDVVLI